MTRVPSPCPEKTSPTYLSIYARDGIGLPPSRGIHLQKDDGRRQHHGDLETRGDLSQEENKPSVTSYFTSFTSHISRTRWAKLSGGERRRVEIARALATEPRVILLDEPFAGVDPISISDIKAIITHLKERGIGVLITDHNVRETLDICERAYIVSEGKVIADGDAQSILDNAKVGKSILVRISASSTTAGIGTSKTFANSIAFPDLKALN